MKQAPSPRPCRECGTTFTPNHPNGALCSDDCRRAKRRAAERRWYAQNIEHCRRKDQEWRDQNRVHLRARRRILRQLNLERFQANRRAWYHAHKDQERASFAAWQSRNRERRTAYQHEWERRKAAIADGKTRLEQGQTTFLLVRALSGYWRAHTEGRKIGATEQIVAVYEALNAHWTVRAPAVANTAQRQMAARLARAEGRRVRHYFSPGKAEAAI